MHMRDQETCRVGGWGVSPQTPGTVRRLDAGKAVFYVIDLSTAVTSEKPSPPRDSAPISEIPKSRADHPSPSSVIQPLPGHASEGGEWVL